MVSLMGFPPAVFLLTREGEEFTIDTGWFRMGTAPLAERACRLYNHKQSESTLRRSEDLDKTDEKILELLKGNARMSYQELGDALGMTRVGAKKRVQKLEKKGIIRGYNTCIYREDEVTMFIDLVAAPGRMEDVIDVLCSRTAYIRQIFRTTKENHIHAVAVSDQVSDLKYLIKMIQKKCGDDLSEIHCHAVKEVIKDVYGGIRYEPRPESDCDGDHEPDGGGESP